MNAIEDVGIKHDNNQTNKQNRQIYIRLNRPQIFGAPKQMIFFHRNHCIFHNNQIKQKPNTGSYGR